MRLFTPRYRSAIVSGPRLEVTGTLIDCPERSAWTTPPYIVGVLTDNPGASGGNPTLGRTFVLPLFIPGTLARQAPPLTQTGSPSLRNVWYVVKTVTAASDLVVRIGIYLPRSERDYRPGRLAPSTVRSIVIGSSSGVYSVDRPAVGVGLTWIGVKVEGTTTNSLNLVNTDALVPEFTPYVEPAVVPPGNLVGGFYTPASEGTGLPSTAEGMQLDQGSMYSIIAVHMV